ncbi:MAG TPA: flagellar assembly protein FliW [Fimbriimonadaceae bacterium]|nr:flagellar assembly protein FliW [Fimbriimonadaceae bacterium]
MKLTGTRFGEIDFGPTDVLFFKEGIIGFPLLQEFILLSHKDDSPFRWLQSVQEPGIAFLCVIPQHFVPDYNPELTHAVVESLKIEEDTERFVLTTASIPKGEPTKMTLNLAAPILVNARGRIALQFVLEDEAYTVKHRVFPEAKVKEGVAA